jgi:hypothetical protein
MPRTIYARPDDGSLGAVTPAVTVDGGWGPEARLDMAWA